MCRFKSNAFLNGPGFILRYESTDELKWSFNAGTCGGNFTTPIGILTSPQYPNYYPKNADCVYTISQPEDNYVILTFLLFSTHKFERPTCKDGFYHGQTSDYLEIRDGNHEKSPLLARVCGTELPSPILSTQNKVWMR